MGTKQRRLRPSASSRWIACPGSVKLAEVAPKEQYSEAAAIGTAIHALAETCHKLETDPMEFVGQVIEEITMTEDHCHAALEHLRQIWDIENHAEKLFIEQGVLYTSKEFIVVKGTADVAAYSMKLGKVWIADLKTGRGFVSENSDQLKIYALGFIGGMNREWIKEIELRIVQPFHGEARKYTMTMAELAEWEDAVLRPAMIATQLDEPPLYVTDAGCQWCPAKSICPKQQQQFDLVAKQTDITSMDKEQIKEVMHTLTIDQITAILDKANHVEKFIDAVRVHAMTQMEGGAVIPGWQLAPKRATRKWVDSGKAAEKLIELGLTRDQVLEQNLISPAEAEKLLPKELRVILDDLSVKVSSGLTLARDRSLSQ